MCINGQENLSSTFLDFSYIHVYLYDSKFISALVLTLARGFYQDQGHSGI
jgi:hypothetical protein